VQQAFVIDEQSADPGGLTHRWLLKALIPAGFVLLGLQSVAEIARHVALARNPGQRQ
jgi:TRAP-type mannitol/chloroaromatic compound transport system permease small subunit